MMKRTSSQIHSHKPIGIEITATHTGPAHRIIFERPSDYNSNQMNPKYDITLPASNNWSISTKSNSASPQLSSGEPIGSNSCHVHWTTESKTIERSGSAHNLTPIEQRIDIMLPVRA
jgi:hypothetical protein